MFDPIPAGAVAPYIAALLARLGRNGAAPALRCDGRDVPARALRDMIFRYARALAGAGIGEGSLVALFAPLRPEALAIRYAAHVLGAAAAFLPAPPDRNTRAALLAQMAPSLLVVFRETASLLPEDCKVPVATMGIGLPGALALDERAALEPAAPIACRATPTALAVVMCSGGGAGVPKGSWRDFAAYTAMVRMPSPDTRRELVNRPLAGLSQVMADITLLGGGTVVLQPCRGAADTLAAIEDERITHLLTTEPLLADIVGHPGLGDHDLSSLRVLTHAGAAAPPALRQRARTRLGPVLAHCYGTDEMGIVSALPPAEYDPAVPARLASAGRLRPGVEIRFRRLDGMLAAPGEPGRIELRSCAMAGGYRNRKEANWVCFRDGWYCSGDLGFLDADGHLHVLGRGTDIARIGGSLIGPAAIEDTLCRLPQVRYAAAAAEAAGNGWVAAVVPRSPVALDMAQLRAAIASAHGAVVAARVALLPVARMAVTEQGMPDREAIRHAAGTPGLRHAA